MSLTYTFLGLQLLCLIGIIVFGRIGLKPKYLFKEWPHAIMKVCMYLCWVSMMGLFVTLL